jgi:hypothetical protein
LTTAVSCIYEQIWTNIEATATNFEKGFENILERKILWVQTLPNSSFSFSKDNICPFGPNIN